MNTSNKTLLQILVEELPKRGGWPADASRIVQDSDGQAKAVAVGANVEYPNIVGVWHRTSGNAGVIDYLHLAADWQTAIITREQYEAALSASKEPLTGTGVDGWIDWPGGECPVNGAVFVDYKIRGGEVSKEYAHLLRWDHKNYLGDIIAYRLHQPQTVEEHTHVGDVAGPMTTAPDEADLNDCIGQTPAPVWNGEGLPPVGAEFNYGSHRSRAKCLAVGRDYVFASKGDPEDHDGGYEEVLIDKETSFHPVDDVRDGLMRDIIKSGSVTATFAERLSQHLIDAGYRKQ